MKLSSALVLASFWLAFPDGVLAEDGRPTDPEAPFDSPESSLGQRDASVEAREVPDAEASRSSEAVATAGADTTGPLRPGETRVSLERAPGEGSQPGLGTLPTHAVTSGVPWSVAVGTQVFAEYQLLFPSGADWNHRFALPRAWGYLAFRLENVTGRVLLEATRGTDDGALSGVADDSLLLRIREAWGGYRVIDLVELRVGLIPTLLAPWLTQHWGLRAVGRVGLRDLELVAPADLGASATVDLPAGFGRVGVSYTNGEGYSSRELNRGKNLEIAADLRPFAFEPALGPLGVLVGYTNGSLGAGSARSDRVVGSLYWDQRELGVGMSAAYVMGLADRGEREGAVVDAWARGLILDHLILGAQLIHFMRDLSSGADTLTRVTFSAGGLILDQLRVYVAADGRFADAAARVASPWWEGWDVRLVVEADVVVRVLGAL
ncbi:MAG: hypothetical protein K1X94_25350 [Sandaracinaceae bacterium]|nr:hypothetical protein [Sandaracinaceae bacterium]